MCVKGQTPPLVTSSRPRMARRKIAIAIRGGGRSWTSPPCSLRLTGDTEEGHEGLPVVGVGVGGAVGGRVVGGAVGITRMVTVWVQVELW